MVEAWLPLPVLPMCKTLIITLFCYNTDSTGPQNQCYNEVPVYLDVYIFMITDGLERVEEMIRRQRHDDDEVIVEKMSNDAAMIQNATPTRKVAAGPNPLTYKGIFLSLYFQQFCSLCFVLLKLLHSIQVFLLREKFQSCIKIFSLSSDISPILVGAWVNAVYLFI